MDGPIGTITYFLYHKAFLCLSINQFVEMFDIKKKHLQYTFSNNWSIKEQYFHLVRSAVDFYHDWTHSSFPYDC